MGSLPGHSHTVTTFSSAGDDNIGILSWQFEFQSRIVRLKQVGYLLSTV